MDIASLGALSPLLLLVAAALLVFLFIRIIRLPFKLIFKLLLHAAVGVAALFIFNFFGSYLHISLPITPLNAIIAGTLGVPGVILMLLIKYFL